MEPPQKIKHHLGQLEKRGFLRVDKLKGVMDVATPGSVKGLNRNATQIFNIPIVGTANCGPATVFAEANFQGFVRASSRVLGRSKATGLFAIRADGSSMNRAEVDGKRIADGDYLLVDSGQKSPRNGDIVVSVIDGMANVKRFASLTARTIQIVLMSESSFDFQPIHIHPDDDFFICGKVVERDQRSLAQRKRI
jgi:SOS-response transcriptional repressor LexA